MTIEQELKNYILSRYSSIREFSISINIPYSTLDSIFKRGVENANIANIIRICDALNISADELASGRIAIKSDKKLCPDEEEILLLYRSMNQKGKDLVLTTVRTYAGNPDMQKGLDSAAIGASAG